MGGSLLATIDDSTVNTSGGAVIVDAFADKTIEANGQAVGVAAGGAGAVSFNVSLSAVVATNVIANFKQVVKEGSLRLHPLIARLVDEETLKKMGAEKIGNARAAVTN